MPTLHPLPTMIQLCAHETPNANLEVLKSMFHVLLLDLIPSFLTFYGLDKGFCFSHQLGDWYHDKGKVFDETSIKLSHTIKNPNLLWIGKYWHVHYFLNLLKSSIFPSLETMNPKINPKNTIKTHFFKLKLILYSLHLKAKSKLHQMTFHITINYEIF